MESEPKGSKGMIPWLLVLAIVIVAGGAAIWVLKSKASKKTSEDSANLRKTSETARSDDTASRPTNLIDDKGNAVRSIDDLKVGAITLEKAKGSSLVYAVGVLRNNSDLHRFGVTLELDLVDSRGNSAGSAKDYRSVIEPRQEWRFRALVLDSKAVSARLARIREEQ